MNCWGSDRLQGSSEYALYCVKHISYGRCRIEPEPFVFAIPLRAKAIARDWGRVSHLLACTLDSILNQTDPNFCVALACHDVPDLPILADSRISILRTEAPLPRDLKEQMQDKQIKKRLALAHLHELGGGWFMPVDSDDLVSRRLVNHVRQTNPRFGFILDEGWEFDCVHQGLRPAPRFNRLCGTSGIFRFTLDDLPNRADQNEETLADAFKNHTHWRETASTAGRPLDLLGFRGAIYTTNNQENHSILVGDVGWKRRLTRIVSPLRRPSIAEVDEFSLRRLLG